MYSETCANGHLYSETTCIKRPLCPKGVCAIVFKDHLSIKGALAWPFNTGFTVITYERRGVCILEVARFMGHALPCNASESGVILFVCKITPVW